MALTLKALLGKGYFPQELPPSFTTKSYARFMSGRSPVALFRAPWKSRPELYNLARTGSLRRSLSILNPIHFGKLAEYIVSNWTALLPHCTGSKFSLTQPKVNAEGRAIGRSHPFADLPSSKARLRTGSKFILSADISRFYPSIYTHVIPWVIHTKVWSKSHRGIACLGNDLDRLIRNCQDDQTNGIPIGPDTSLIIAEMLLKQIDSEIYSPKIKGFRYMDDFEIAANTEHDIETTLGRLQAALLKLELHLNPSKTGIVALPVAFQDRWVPILKDLSLHPLSGAFRGQLISFFDKAFELSKLYPSDGVLKYALGRFANLTFTRELGLAEDLLLQSARIESGTLPFVLEFIMRLIPVSRSRSKIRNEVFAAIIRDHAPQGHSSEVAWSLWGCIGLSIPIPGDIAAAVVEMEDSVCALLLLHAQQVGLISAKRQIKSLSSVSRTDELYDSRWLLSYEANIKGWLPSATPDHVLSDHNFSILKSGGVTFYDPTILRFPAPRGARQRATTIQTYGSVESDVIF